MVLVRPTFPILLGLPFLATACGDNLNDSNESIVVHSPRDLDPGVRPAVDDLVGDLAELAGFHPGEAHLPDPGCTDGKIRVVFLGHEHDERGDRVASDLIAQNIEVTETRCGDGGRRVVIRGGSRLSGQWAAYAFLETLGIRYFHPEHTFYPQRLDWPDGPIAIAEGPEFRRRSMHAHRTHPIELSAPRFFVDLDMAGYQRRWIDWNVKLRQTGIDGWDESLVGTYAYDRGFPRNTGFNLLNSQQGGRPILDPDDPRSEAEQIAEAIDERMTPIEGLPDPGRFGFQFNPSEFTEADHQTTVDRLTFITDYVTDNYPGTEVVTTNHGTFVEPGELGVAFFDLPELAPPELGVQTHTLMFYDLERPAAGIYGNESFAHKLRWNIEQQEVRRIIHYPESSWWLTFDLPVPLYLAPVTLEARDYDIRLLESMLSPADDSPAGIYGHHLFTSGQEWGYWMIDYCVAQMAWDLSSHTECVADFTGRFAGGDEILAVLGEVEARQVVDLRDPELLRFLVGSDDETETAAAAGIDFHPLPPAPVDILGLDDAAVADLESLSLTPLEAMAADYHGWADRVEALLPLQTGAQAAWVREIVDGLRVFALRAEHAGAVYRTALALRAAIAAGDLGTIGEIAEAVEAVRAITARAEQVIRRREADYRYPDELTIIGDEPGADGAEPNQTIYPYRYLSRTHRLFYWHRPDDQLAALFGEGLELVRVNQRIAKQGSAIEVTLLAEVLASLQIDWGDGGALETALAPHVYADQGIYDWVLDAVADGAALHHEDQAAVVTDKLIFAKGSLMIAEPEGAGVIAGLIPGFVVGLGDDGAPFMVLGRIDGTEAISAKGSLLRRARTGDQSGPADLDLELPNVGTITVFDAVVTADPGAATLEITGEMSTQQIIDRIVGVGGFDEEGARELVADILGYTPSTLPERVSFVIEAVGTAA